MWASSVVRAKVQLLGSRSSPALYRFAFDATADSNMSGKIVAGCSMVELNGTEREESDRRRSEKRQV